MKALESFLSHKFGCSSKVKEGCDCGLAEALVQFERLRRLYLVGSLMRKMQKNYFKNRFSGDLAQAKKLEAEFDGLMGAIVQSEVVEKNQARDDSQRRLL